MWPEDQSDTVIFRLRNIWQVGFWTKVTTGSNFIGAIGENETSWIKGKILSNFIWGQGVNKSYMRENMLK